ncbi:ABC transporter ATP-binding protein [Eubacterium multiforme]|uniref:ABC-2 type transport system ATP-binding protein n=1 Tax=Eubacterium multiforme TaxID=83339 RepID=A0ABT9UY73_9FIRM|nr:ABC transporter ATP-binding protein [Eubacterium multiforme]MDQ0151277.1 ABC-2 type transport system ATP-binding protein [Eubacterium multiforme]
MKDVLEVCGLNKYHKNFKLNNINLSLKENCITGFIGVNGAGKTTTIKTILGLSLKESGNIKVFGDDITGNEAKIKNRIGVVLDNGGFYEDLSMDEMKSIIAPLYSNWNEEKYKYYMRRFSLKSNQGISTLSKGMNMKFALALALSHNADLLIMDEPTSGLDPLVRKELMDILLEFMKEDGKAVFFSTHITSDLENVADVLILIHEGKIIFQEEKDVLLDTHRLVKGYDKKLTDDIRALFIDINETDFGFSGISKNINKLQSIYPDLIIEKPTIENIMLSYIERRKSNDI